MRKWRNLAAQNDPEAWFAVGNLWPTIRGTYQTADGSSGSSVTNPGGGVRCCYAFSFGPSQEFLAVNSAGSFGAWYWNGSTLSALTTGLGASGTIFGDSRSFLQMVRYGTNAVLLAVSAGGVPLPSLQACTFTGSTPSNFTSIANSPTNRNIVAAQSAVALTFSTADNVWNASDVGDYTNWITGESASGSLYQLPLFPTAAVAYGNDIYVFKPGGILRMTYVGGLVKWQVQMAWSGIGLPRDLTATAQQPTQDQAVATNHGIAFYGGNGLVYLFDGASEPVVLNPDTTIPVEAIYGVFTYDSSQDRLCISPSFGCNASGQGYTDSSTTLTSLPYHYYSFRVGAWGTGYGGANEVTSGQLIASGVVRGLHFNRKETGSSKPAYWNIQNSSPFSVIRNAPASPASGATCSIQSSKYGSSDGKTTFTRLIPQLRSRADLGSGSVSLQFDLSAELEDTTTTSSRTISEATNRKRFDLLGGIATDTFGRFKLTYSNLNIEIDDVLVKSLFVQDGE